MKIFTKLLSLRAKRSNPNNETLGFGWIASSFGFSLSPRNDGLDFKYISILWLVLILAIIPTYAHHGHLIIDCGREAYYPTQILAGDVLYKDILNIYGPFSYMFNALLFKIFGINLNVLYLAGCVCAFLITTLIYLISSKFLSKFVSYSIAILTIAAGVFNLHLFNFIFPYSYAILYGLTFFLLSVYFLLNYQECTDNKLNLYLSCLFAGCCIANKYEFLPCLLIIFYTLFKLKTLKNIEYFYSLIFILFIPVICFGLLFLQGLHLNDIYSSILVVNKMIHTNTLRFFYKSQGIYLTPKLIKLELYNLLITSIGFILFLFGFKLKNRLFSFLTIFLSMTFIAVKFNFLSFSFLPTLVLVLSIFNYKNLIVNYKLQILVFSGILFSLKVFNGFFTTNYGIYFISYLLIVCFVLIFDLFKEKMNIKAVGSYVIFLAVLFAYNGLHIHTNDVLIESSRGKHFYIKKYVVSSKDLINYLVKNTKKSDTVVILPEGALINFLAERKSDNYYTSLIPLYVETFGEDNIIAHFKTTKPEYIIFNNWDSYDYGKRFICVDYAQKFCSYVEQNYTEEKILGDEFRYLIFKKK